MNNNAGRMKEMINNNNLIIIINIINLDIFVAAATIPISP